MALAKQIQASTVMVASNYLPAVRPASGWGTEGCDERADISDPAKPVGSLIGCGCPSAGASQKRVHPGLDTLGREPRSGWKREILSGCA